MRIIKKANSDVVREDAHGGSGGRKLFIDDGEIKNVAAMTYVYLPAGNKFAWHLHEGMNEMMLVTRGSGIVRDEDGEYPYNVGDFFVLPSGVLHEIENTSEYENEMVFVRVKENLKE